MSKWLSVTNKKSVGRSDSVRQTKQICVTVTQWDKQYWNKYPISLWHVTKEWRKKTTFQNWISPPLSNCFGVPLTWHISTVDTSATSARAARIEPHYSWIGFQAFWGKSFAERVGTKYNSCSLEQGHFTEPFESSSQFHNDHRC